MKKIDEGLMRKYIEREAANGLKGPKWDKYFREKASWIVELTDGTLFVIEKPSIKTHFCFGENGYDFDEAVKSAYKARTDESLFRIRNMRGIDEKIKLLKEGPEPGDRIWVCTGTGVAEYLNCGRDWQFKNCNTPVMEIGEEDRKRLLEGYKMVRDRFEKRITSYLKRFGMTKVRSWTYWVDA